MQKHKALAFTGHRPESLPFGENELLASAIRIKTLLRTEQPSGHRQPGGVRSGAAGAGVAQKPEWQIQRKKLFCLARRLRRLRRVLRQQGLAQHG